MAAVAAAPRQKPLSRRESDSSPTNLPIFRTPQKPHLREKLPQGEDWIFEVKFDGYRAEAALAADQVHLYSSSGADWSETKFAGLVPAFRKLKSRSLLIDGEVCALDEKGRPNFSLLKSGLDGKQPLVFFAFDLLEQDGEDLRALPLIERKARLERLLGHLPEGSPIRYSWHARGDGAAMLEAMRANEMEGVVAKRVDARYSPEKASESWLKVKVRRRQEFVIIGWRSPEAGPDDIRSLYLATNDGGRLIFRGSVGTGFDYQTRREVFQQLRAIRTDDRVQVSGMPRPDMRQANWVKPVLLAEVQFAELTSDGLVRHASFKGLRMDKKATSVNLDRIADIYIGEQQPRGRPPGSRRPPQGIRA